MSQKQSGTSRRLVLYLSGAWSKQCTKKIVPGDLLYCAPDFREKAPGLDWNELPRVPRSSFDELASDYANIVFSDKPISDDALEYALANTHFEYGVSPVAAQLRAIDDLIEKEQPSSLLIFSSRTSLSYIPAIGVVTKESKRGSSHLLGALVAQAIIDSSAGLSHEWVRLRGDILSMPFFRVPLLRTAAVLLSILAAIRIMLSSIPNPKTFEDKCEVVVFVRSLAQAQHASRIFEGVSHVAGLVIPQFTSGNKLPVISRSAKKRIRLFRPSSVDVLFALLGSVFYSSVRCRRVEATIGKLAIGRFAVTISGSDLARELWLIPALVFHRSLLSRSLSRLSKLRRTVGFEIKGSFSTIEAMAGRAAKAEAVSVQTVLVPPRPLPIFPWADKFFADSQSSARRISQIGQRPVGNVVFCGAPHSAIPISRFTELRTVMFLSQPYESVQTNALLRDLARAARKFGFNIRMRLHPRDKQETYSEILSSTSDVLRVSKNKTLDEDILAADLCVTRVSSTAKESLAVGRPILICLWSEYDRSVVADYIADDKLADGYVAYNTCDLFRIIEDIDQIIAVNTSLHTRVFGGEGLQQLREVLVA